MNEPTHLDLFSGIGGFALAAQWAGFRTIGFCEIDRYCQKVLAKNFGAVPYSTNNGHNEFSDNPSQGKRKVGESKSGGNDKLRGEPCGYDKARIFGNIFDLNGRDFAGVSLITGGFPCQPFSVAGKRGGAADDRAIWPEMFRVISEARPAWVLGENVPGIIPMELDNVLSDLEGIGYATRSFVIPACAVDARHRRDRVWIVGRRIIPDSNEEREQRLSLGEKSKDASTGISYQDAERSGGGISNSYQQGLEGQRTISIGNGAQLDYTGDHCRWLPEPDVGRVAHGIPSRVDRLKGLGNAIVPQCAYEILREIRRLI
jgi:DNA (cytosine-5)-methyltransferase 1